MKTMMALRGEIDLLRKVVVVRHRRDLAAALGEAYRQMHRVLEKRAVGAVEQSDNEGSMVLPT